MKKSIQFLLMLAISASVHAGMNDGWLSVTNLSPQDVLIEVDGRQYPESGNVLNLRDLNPGNHIIRVYTSVNKSFLSKKITIYNKTIYVKPRFFVDIIINRFGRALFDEQQMQEGVVYDTDPRNDPRNNDPRNGNNGPGNGNGYNNGPGNGQGNGNGGYGPGNGNGNNGNNNWRNDNMGPRAMSDDMFIAFSETIRRESFDDSRKAIARAGIDQNYFTSAQAKQLLSVFSFEGARLEMAKYMYGKTTDPKNYFVVYSIFSFSKSKEELAEYVRTYR